MAELADERIWVSPTTPVVTPTPPSSVRAETVERRSRLRNPKYALVAADLGALVAALLAALAVRFMFNPRAIGSEEWNYFWLAVGTLPGWLVVFASCKLYSARFVTRQLEESRRVFRGVTSSVVLVSAAGFMVNVDASRGWVLLTLVFALLFVTFERWVARRIFAKLRRSGRLLRPVVVVGGNHEGAELCKMIRNYPHLGYEVRGFVDDDHDHTYGTHQHHPMLGTLEETIDAVRKTGSTGVIIAATAMDLGTSNRLIRELTDAGIHVELSSTLRDIASHRLTVRPLGRFPVVYIEPVQRGGWRQKAKRTFDVVVAGTLLLLAAPVLAVAAIAIKLDSKGPVLFRQTRVGRDGKPFEMLKLRSMVSNAEELLAELRAKNEVDGPLFKMRDDPRITRVGRILRKFSIDELPQLWNVLRNDMSMVGPRPALPHEVDAWGPDLHGRLRVQPGITGMWQVSGRSEASFDEYERLDLYYVDNWSLATDLAIVAKTIPTVLLRKGAF